jgi:hypothetical protein
MHVRGTLQPGLILPTGLEPVPLPNIGVLEKQPVLQHIQIPLNPRIVR